MKSYIYIFMIAICVASCSGSPPVNTTLAANTEYIQVIQPTHTSHPTSTETSTPKPTSTNTIFPTSTNTPTITVLPTLTYTPTDDLPNYEVADCIPKNTLFQEGIVTQVLDGDTITVQLEDGKIYRVRYIGIDAPEKDTPFYMESYAANSDLVAEQHVFLVKDNSETDPFDRLLRYVMVDDTFVNLQMLRTGFASATIYPPDTACADTFSSFESEAKDLQLGMWAATSTPEPSAPEVIIIAVNKREKWVDIQNTGPTDVD